MIPAPRSSLEHCLTADVEKSGVASEKAKRISSASSAARTGFLPSATANGCSAASGLENAKVELRKTAGRGPSLRRDGGRSRGSRPQSQGESACFRRIGAFSASDPKIVGPFSFLERGKTPVRSAWAECGAECALSAG